MKNSTKEYLLKAFNKDGIGRLDVDKLTKADIDKLRIKLMKKFKTIRWLFFITLILILCTFIFLSFIESAHQYYQDITRFWAIFMMSFLGIVAMSPVLWNSRRNLMILDILEKELD